MPRAQVHFMNFDTEWAFYIHVLSGSFALMSCSAQAAVAKYYWLLLGI